MMSQTWAGTAANQCVGWDALIDGIYTQYLVSGSTGISSSNRNVFKSLASLPLYLNLDTSNAGYVSRASNQLLWKSDIVNLLPYSYVIYGVLGDAEQGWPTSSAACLLTVTGTTSTFFVTLYCNTSSIHAGSQLYFSSGTPFYGWNSDLWFYNFTNSFPFQLNGAYSNVVSSVGTCNFSINLQAKSQSSVTNPAARFYYRIGSGGAWNFMIQTTVGVGGYGSIQTISVAPGSVLYFAVQNTSSVNMTFGSGSGGLYNGWCGESSPYLASSNVTGNATYYVNLETNNTTAYITC